MKLTYRKREKTSKGANNALRREGRIPAVLYSKGQAGECLSVDRDEYDALLRGLKPGRLSTQVIELTSEDGASRRALVKDVGYEITSYRVQHLDFEELHDDQPVSVRVPIEVTGDAECKGVKLGGFLRRIIRGIRCTCLPAHIPTHFEIDVRDLGLKQSRKLHTIRFPDNVRPRARLEEVAVIVAKK